MSATKPVLQVAIQQYAKQLRSPTLGDQFARLAEEAVKEKQSHLSYLEALLAAEVEERDHHELRAFVGAELRVCPFGHSGNQAERTTEKTRCLSPPRRGAANAGCSASPRRMLPS
jgi:hypothetical protein